MFKFVYQQVTDLVLGVANRRLTVATTVFDERLYYNEEWTCRVQIIGESHVVEIAYQEQVVLTEILACIDLNPADLCHYYALANLDRHQWECSGYRTQLEITTIDSDQSLPAFGVVDLEVTFPDAGKHAHMALTQVRFHTIADQFVWKTRHVYPEDDHTVCVDTASWLKKNIDCLF